MTAVWDELLAVAVRNLNTCLDLSAEVERLREALAESDDMLRGWLAQTTAADDAAYRGMALSTDTILREHARTGASSPTSETER